MYSVRRGFTNPGGTQPVFWLNTVFAAGHYGVSLFFSISGFILSVPFARHALRGAPAVNLREYYLRRLTRIEPPYVIQLVIMLALCAFVLRHTPSQTRLYHNPDWFQFALAHISSSLIYAHSAIFGYHAYPNIVLWSLEVEVQFYLLAPWLARIFFVKDKILRWSCFIALIAAGVCAECFFGSYYRYWTSLAGNLHLFLVGFLFADLFVDGRLESLSRSPWWDLGFAIALAVVVLATGHLISVLLPVAVFACFLAAFRGVLAARLLRNSWVAVIGGMCYTIYLYHDFILLFAFRFTEKIRVANLSLDLLIQFALITTTIVSACALLFVFLEKPFMDRDWPIKFARTLRRWRSGRAGDLVGGDPERPEEIEQKPNA